MRTAGVTSYFDVISALAIDLIGTLIYKPTPSYGAAADFLAQHASHVTPDGFCRTFQRPHWEHSVGNYEKDREFYSAFLADLFLTYDPTVEALTDTYEALTVHPPRGECEKLCAFLGLAFDDAMLHFHVDRAKPDLGLELKRAGLPVIPGLRDWQSQMSAEELERFEVTAGELLDELHDPRATPRPRPEVLDQAASVHCSLAENLRARD